MKLLPSLNPSTDATVHEGLFVIHKTETLLGLALDQAHEQNNSLVRSDGDAAGLTENSRALRRWMVAGPKISRLSQDFNVLYFFKSDDTESPHEQKKSTQRTFYQCYFSHLNLG